MENTQEVTPKEYFDRIKNLKQSMQTEELDTMYDKLLAMANTYNKTGQTQGLKKILFFLESIDKEQKVIEAGVDTFVNRSDIEDYIENVSDEVVKIIELRNYEREIPADIVEVLGTVEDYFDEFYIVFTDYTGEHEKKVEKERREKDPILFGVFKDTKSEAFVDRMYFIGDWIDEHCDLTLERMVNEYKDAEMIDIEHKIVNNTDQLSFLELKVALDKNEVKGNSIIHHAKSMFDKVRTFLSAK